MFKALSVSHSQKPWIPNFCEIIKDEDVIEKETSPNLLPLISSPHYKKATQKKTDKNDLIKVTRIN